MFFNRNKDKQENLHLESDDRLLDVIINGFSWSDEEEDDLDFIYSDEQKPQVKFKQDRSK